MLLTALWLRTVGLFPCKLSYPSSRNLVGSKEIFVYTKNELISNIKKGERGKLILSPWTIKECQKISKKCSTITK